MLWGASTANLYPDLTEHCLEQLLQLGFRQIEVFLNTESETAPAFLQAMKDRADAAGASFTSVPAASRICCFRNMSGAFAMDWRCTNRCLKLPPGCRLLMW